MKNILVTGGAGYIGNILIRNLLSRNFNVTVFDNFYYDQFNSILDLVSLKNLNIIENDVRNTTELLDQVKLNDVIIPLAGIVGAPACSKNEKLATEVNTVQIKEISKNLSKDQIIIYLLPIVDMGLEKREYFVMKHHPLIQYLIMVKRKLKLKNILLKKIILSQ